MDAPMTSDDCFTMSFSLSDPAFAVLSGRYMQTTDDSVQYSRVHFPLLRLPVVLGRTHITEDRHFLGLGNCKALSRNHASIYFRDAQGGRLDQGVGDTFQYIHSAVHSKPVIHDGAEPIPEHGFYVIECLGKNKLFVDKQRVEQGQVALLKHGSTIKMASYFLYFILPERPPDYVPREFKSPMKVKNTKIPNIPDSELPFNKISHGNDADDDDDHDCADNKEEADLQIDSNTLSKVDLLDRGKTTEELLQLVDALIAKGNFNRTLQHYSSALMLHAIRDLCRDQSLQVISRNDNGLLREKITAWIQESPSYGPWYKFMQSNMKQKSVDSNLTRALLKVGFGKRGSSGRYVLWIMPELNDTDKRNIALGEINGGDSGMNQSD